MADVVCVGILVADVVARPVDHYPERGELNVCEQIFPSIGGCAANTGVGLQKLGVPTAVIGKVGRDGFGDFVRGTLQGHGLDVRGVVNAATTTTSATMVMVASDGERSFIHYKGANDEFGADDVNWDIIQGAKLLHVAGHFLMAAFDGAPCARVLKRAQEMGVKTALDTAWDASGRWMETLRPCLPYLDYFVPSYAEARRCVESFGTGRDTPEEVARVFLGEGVGVVALKMGEMGSYIRKGDEEWRVPAFPVTAIDANGAGDAFAAGFLAGISSGYDLPTTGKLANAVGASCVTAMGTVAGIRSLEETREFIEAQERSGWRAAH